MPKNILVFLDGTRNKSSAERQRRATNVWKLYRAVSARHDGHEPIAVYIRGVGTLPDPVKQQPAEDLNFRRLRQWLRPAEPAQRVARKVLQCPKRIALRYGASAIGWGVADRIREAYAYLSEHYQRGDHVYLFGFSRGAFEARSLAGFVDAVGLLLADKMRGPDPRRLVDIAYHLYRRGDAESMAFLHRFLRRVTGRAAPQPGAEVRRLSPVDLHFAGVWDTVAAIGFDGGNEHVPLVRAHTTHHLVDHLPGCIRHGRHALALHELRHKFEPRPWVGVAAGQDIQQCWFAGAHADVGGGYPEGESQLADIALHWMAGEASAVSTLTARPLRFVGLPDAPSAMASRPHHAIQGEFFWATPKPRMALHSAQAWRSLAGDVTVHPSAVARLFDAQATEYVRYPFEPDLKWAETLGLGENYPRDAAAVLHWIDERTIASHLQACERRFAVAPSAAGLPPWRVVAGVADMRLLDDLFATAALDAPSRFTGGFDLAAAFALLVLLDRDATLDAFTRRVDAAVDVLIAEAAESSSAGLRIRDTRLPLFIALCKQSRPDATRLHPTLVARLAPRHEALCAACARLRAQLPMRAPPRARFKPRD